MRHRRRLTDEERIRNLVLRRRRDADRRIRVRAERMGAHAVDISREEIFQRDGALCHLCGKETSVHDRTLDHVVPLIRGGDHIPANVRIAHKRCNEKKGMRLLNEIDFSDW